MPKHVCCMKVLKTVHERTVQNSLQARETPTARDCLTVALYLMSPMRIGGMVDAGYCMMNEIAKWRNFNNFNNSTIFAKSND